MYSLLFISWMCLPIAPLNPLEQDTLTSVNLHFSVGVSSPNGIVSLGPELSTRYEMLAVHPFVIRGAVDYRYGKMKSRLFPQGDIHTTMFSIEGLYYRGNNHLTAYVGLGAVYAFNWFSPLEATSDSLWVNESVTDLDMAQQMGYRITMGLRYHKSYSIEIGVTELHPSLIKWGRTGIDNIYREHEKIRTGGFRITLGYLLPLSRY